MQIPMKEVEIFEVGPRDGLQNEPTFIETEKKIKLVEMLQDAGCRKIEVTSFVHPKWVPQMADSIQVLEGITNRPGIVYSALIPNMKGMQRAVEAGLDEVVTIMSASESHNTKNLNMSVERSLEEVRNINEEARKHGMRVRSYIGTAYGCPMEGAVPVSEVARIAKALEDAGSYEISLGDTTGMAYPQLAFEVASAVLDVLTTARTAVHFHRARGIECANVLASLQAGVTVIDSAAGGLGGCPYAPGATGNMATELLVDMLHRMGIATGIDLGRMEQAAQFAKQLVSQNEKE